LKKQKLFLSFVFYLTDLRERETPQEQQVDDKYWQHSREKGLLLTPRPKSSVPTERRERKKVKERNKTDNNSSRHSSSCEHKKQEKQTMVVETNALIDIRTMMIKTSNTSIAIRTVKKIDILIF
jgi:hypothetical protein